MSAICVRETDGNVVFAHEVLHELIHFNSYAALQRTLGGDLLVICRIFDRAFGNGTVRLIAECQPNDGSLLRVVEGLEGGDRGLSPSA